MYLGRLLGKLTYFAAMLLATEAMAVRYSFVPEKGLELTWDTDDKVGVTTGNVSYGMMEQLAFWTSGKTTSQRNERSIYAIGYQLKTNTAYFSYSPYQWSDDFNANSIACSYDAQSQSGNGSTATLAAVDHSMAAAVSSSVDCVFSYRHIGGILRISFSAPEAMNITSLSLKAQETMIATSATMNILAQTVALGDKAAAVTVETENISVAKGQEVVIYLALPAQDLSSAALDIVVTDSNGKETTIAKVYGPNVKAGSLYDMCLDAASASKAGNITAEAKPSNSVQDITAEGITNPLVRISDILIDKDYTVHLVPTVKKGDVNGDGLVNTMDAIALIGFYLNNQTEQVPLTVGDMNGDKLINTMDAIEIISIYLNAK